MRPKNASSRRCGFWGVRRCRGGGKHAEVTEREIRQQPHMHRQGKKSSLAYEARRNRDLRAAIPFREGTRSSVRAECASNASDVFAALAARHHRFCRRSIFRSRANRIAGALRLYDWREHDPEDRSGPRPEHVRGRSTFPRFSQNAGSSQAYHSSNRWRDDPYRRAGPRPEGQAYRQAALMERGQDFAGARQGEPNAGLRRHDRGRGGNGRTAASRMRGSGRFRLGLPRPRGRRRSSLDRRPGGAAIWPIGSGEIESAQRYIAQQRLKRPGAWWRVKHAEYMLAVRITRRNDDWEAYWPPSANTPRVQTPQL
jgi:hypothetical protein